MAVESFSCLTEAKVMVEDFRVDYNHHRPHCAHHMLTPAAFAESWKTTQDAAPASAELQPASGRLPSDAGDSLTVQKPTNHQLPQQVDR